MMINIDSLKNWIYNRYHENDIVVKPQNMSKSSLPAKLLNKYHLPEDTLVWVYKRGGLKYFGFFFRKGNYADEIKSWLRSRMDKAKNIIKGKEYVYVEENR